MAPGARHGQQGRVPALPPPEETCAREAKESWGGGSTQVAQAPGGRPRRGASLSSFFSDESGTEYPYGTNMGTLITRPSVFRAGATGPGKSTSSWRWSGGGVVVVAMCSVSRGWSPAGPKRVVGRSQHDGQTSGAEQGGEEECGVPGWCLLTEQEPPLRWACSGGRGGLSGPTSFLPGP